MPSPPCPRLRAALPRGRAHGGSGSRGGAALPFWGRPKGCERAPRASHRGRPREKQEQEQGHACWKGAGAIGGAGKFARRALRGEEGEGGDGESEPCLSGWK